MLTNRNSVTGVLAEDGPAEQALRELVCWPGYTAIRSVLSKYSALEIYLAGGAVRNAILQRTLGKDFDLFLSGPYVHEAINDIAVIGTMTIGPLGSPRWTPAVGANPCDLVPIANVNHGLGFSRDIADALRRFDFTGNAIAINLRTRHIINPVGGLGDLERRTMRATRFDFPDTPVQPNSFVTWRAVQWLRIVHYAAKLDLAIEPVTFRWLRTNTHYRGVAREFARLFFEPRLELPLSEPIEAAI